MNKTDDIIEYECDSIDFNSLTTKELKSIVGSLFKKQIETSNKIDKLEKQIKDLKRNKNIDIQQPVGLLLQNRELYLKNTFSNKNPKTWIQIFSDFNASDEDLQGAFNSDIYTQIIKIIHTVNKVTPFIYVFPDKKTVFYFYDNSGEWSKIENTDLKKMFFVLETKLMVKFQEYAEKISLADADDYFENSKKMYNVNLNTHFNKIRSELSKKLCS